MSGGFYRAFEERLRGSRELIKGRLEAYLPFVEPLLAAYPAVAAVDLGCGRGEWVELLAESGFIPVGVDLDAGMLDACIKLGLPVEQCDAIGYLCALPDESQVVVSAFHVVEHIAFEQLQTLVAEALRVLKPGGLLIMETPNPENIVVASCSFYLDPTHQRPIPPMLLAFVAEYGGFARVKTIRLQESKELFSRVDISLQDVITSASPDYAVIAQKHAPDNILAFTCDPFEADYGLSLEDLLGRWDRRFDRLESKAQEADSKAQEADSIAQQSWSKAHQAIAASDEYQARLMSIYKSTSWRITKPLRWTVDHLRKLRQLRLHQRVKELMKLGLLKGVRLIGTHPRMKRAAILRAIRLRLVSKNHRVYSAQAAPVIFCCSFPEAQGALKDKSTHVRRIFVQLKVAVEAHQDAHR